MAGQADPSVGHPPLPTVPAAHEAALLGEADTLSQLCQDAANVETRDHRGYTTLMSAVENVDVREVVRRLILQFGADVNAKQVGNFCQLFLLTASLTEFPCSPIQNKQCYILHVKRATTMLPNCSLQRVPRCHSVTLVFTLSTVASGCTTNKPHAQISGRNAFHWAVLGLDAVVIRRLMDLSDSSVWDARDVSKSSLQRRRRYSTYDSAQCTGYTPLLTACEYGRLDTVKVLKTEGANLHATTRLSHNAMELCDWYGHGLSFKQVDTRNPEQHMPLMGQHMAYNTAGPGAAQYMQMAAATVPSSHGMMHPAAVQGPMQPQAIPFSRAADQFSSTVQRMEQQLPGAAVHASASMSAGPSVPTSSA